MKDGRSVATDVFGNSGREILRVLINGRKVLNRREKKWYSLVQLPILNCILQRKGDYSSTVGLSTVLHIATDR